MNNKSIMRPHLKLFSEFPEEFSSKPGVASALQSFETAIYCIALKRWPATVGLIWQANELLLQYLYKGNLDETSTIAAMDKHLKDGNVSSELNKSAHNLRKTRNSFMHDGFSPKDDLLSVQMYFQAGVPYFDNLLKTAFKCSVYDFCGTGGEQWFWNIYKKTRKVIIARIEKHDTNPLSATNIFIHACHKIVSTNGLFEEFLSPYNPYEDFLAEHHDGILYEIEKVIIEDFVKNNFSNCTHDLVWMNIDCHICNTELMGLCKWDDKENFIEPIAFGCAKCGYAEKDIYAAKYFLEDMLALNKKAKMTWNEMTLVKDRTYF